MNLITYLNDIEEEIVHEEACKSFDTYASKTDCNCNAQAALRKIELMRAHILGLMKALPILDG